MTCHVSDRGVRIDILWSSVVSLVALFAEVLPYLGAATPVVDPVDVIG